MKLSDVMSAAGLSGYATIALVIFFGCFVLLALHLFLTRGAPHWEHVKRLPLEDDPEPRGPFGDSP